jgi:sRNA-binding carbon storage regulator CsrA
MRGLTLTRTTGQQIHLKADEGMTAEELLEELQGGIMITLLEYRSGAARINIQAPGCIDILRPEYNRIEEVS